MAAVVSGGCSSDTESTGTHEYSNSEEKKVNGINCTHKNGYVKSTNLNNGVVVSPLFLYFHTHVYINITY